MVVWLFLSSTTGTISISRQCITLTIAHSTCDMLDPFRASAPHSDAPGGPAPRVPDLWYSDKVDTWSLGCLAFELLCGKCPFEVEDATQAAGLILFGEISQVRWIACCSRRSD